MTLAAGVTNQFEPAGKWCWVTKPIWQLFLLYLYVAVGLVVSVFSYSQVARVMIQAQRKEASISNHHPEDTGMNESSRSTAEATLFLRMVGHITVFVIIWFPPAILRLSIARDKDSGLSKSSGFWMTVVFLVPFQGFLNAVVLLTNTQIARSWKRLLKSERMRFTNEKQSRVLPSSSVAV
eukprot:c10365_g1_i2.p1 GENE.c10365_g1_i2~~c10365_g1_i2.p1  ORF type:complete len:180 (+),score=14.56 c10365_g1_i2:566-1105(+)